MNRATGTHDCPGRCGQQVSLNLFACAADWDRLPVVLRGSITANYRRDFGAHMAAMIDAKTWYHDKPLEARDDEN